MPDNRSGTAEPPHQAIGESLESLAGRAAAGDRDALERVCEALRLTRAGQTIRPIIADRCGPAGDANPCRCDRQIQGALESGLIPSTRSVVESGAFPGVASSPLRARAASR